MSHWSPSILNFSNVQNARFGGRPSKSLLPYGIWVWRKICQFWRYLQTREVYSLAHLQREQRVASLLAAPRDLSGDVSAPNPKRGSLAQNPPATSSAQFLRERRAARARHSAQVSRDPPAVDTPSTRRPPFGSVKQLVLSDAIWSAPPSFSSWRVMHLPQSGTWAP